MSLFSAGRLLQTAAASKAVGMRRLTLRIRTVPSRPCRDTGQNSAHIGGRAKVQEPIRKRSGCHIGGRAPLQEPLRRRSGCHYRL